VPERATRPEQRSVLFTPSPYLHCCLLSSRPDTERSQKKLRLNPNAACARHTSEKTATERLPGRAEKQLTPLRSADEMTNERAQQVRDHVTQTT